MAYGNQERDEKQLVQDLKDALILIGVPVQDAETERDDVILEGFRVELSDFLRRNIQGRWESYVRGVGYTPEFQQRISDEAGRDLVGGAVFTTSSLFSALSANAGIPIQPVIPSLLMAFGAAKIGLGLFREAKVEIMRNLWQRETEQR